jgi:hypothetical protein
MFVMIRLGLFAGILAIMLALGFDPFFSAMIAAVVGLSLSLLFFNSQRAAMSEAIERWVNRKRTKDELAEDGDSSEDPKPGA